MGSSHVPVQLFIYITGHGIAVGWEQDYCSFFWRTPSFINCLLQWKKFNVSVLIYGEEFELSGGFWNTWGVLTAKKIRQSD